MQPSRNQSEAKPKQIGGEGNKTADRNYRAGVKRHLATHDVEQEARDAAKALDNKEEAAELARAEKAARKPQR